MICGKCKKDKLLSDFYATGPPCKKCRRSYDVAYIKRNRSRIREYGLKYEASEGRKTMKRKWYLANKAQISRARKEYKKRYPEKRRAHKFVYSAIKSGRLYRQPCEICGTEKNIHAHHDDYAKPLDIRWFCITHHNLYHSLPCVPLGGGLRNE